MSSDLLDKYVSLKNHMAKLQTQIDELKPKVATYVFQQGGSVLHKDFHLCTRVSKVWEFSEEVFLLENITREKKRLEIKNGKAKLCRETLFVIMRPKRSRSRRQPEPPRVREPREAYDVSEIRKRHARAYMPWSDDEDSFVVTQFQHGYSIDEISGTLQRNEGAIRSRLNKLGQIR